jgi:phospholipid/cholesterol/gamma-HCH transport system permease protein
MTAPVHEQQLKFQATSSDARDRLSLAGECRMDDVAALESALRAIDAAAPPMLTLDLTGAGAFDIGPAWLLHRAIAGLGARGTSVTVEGEKPAHFGYLDGLAAGESAIAVTRTGPAPVRWLADVGRGLEVRARTWYEALVFGGQLITTAGTRWSRLEGLRVPSVVRHVYETGVRAIPVVGVIAFLISVIAAYIGAQQLRPFGAEIYTVDLVAIGVLRELGVLLTAIMVAGRTGSAYAAELGVMKLNDEVDALESMGLNPLELLVLPRVVGLVLAMPLLTIVADAMGLAGGAVLTRYLFDLTWPQFVARLNQAIADTTFWAGLVKAPAFGLVIGLTGTLRGLQVRESSRELGRLTTVAVVQSIFLVILVDALFAVLFLKIDF